MIRVWYRPGFPASTVLSAAKTALAAEAALLGRVSVRDLRPRPDRRRLRDGVAGPDVDPDRRRQPALSRRPRDRPPVVLRDRRQRPGAPAVRRRGGRPTSSPATCLGLRRASRCSTARLDLTIYRYSSACYYEDIYIQGGNFLDDTRKADGLDARSGPAIRDYLAANRFKLAATKTLLDTLDAHTSLNLVPRYQPRFPRLY